MGKLFIPLFWVLFSVNTSAQTVSVLADFTTDTASTQRPHPESPEPSLVSAGGGKTGKVAKEKAFKATGRSGSWLTTLYLHPAEQHATPARPMVPALMFEGIPAQPVSTTEGPRRVRQLRKGDILYHYESSTRQVSAWEVRIVQRKARRAEVPYSLVTKKNGFLFGERIALKRWANRDL